MMKRLYAAFVDGFGPEAGRELFEAAERGLDCLRGSMQRHLEDADPDAACAPSAPAPFDPPIRA